MPDTIPAGCYVCVRTGGWLAWLIRKSTKSAVNHALIVGPGGSIYEATPAGVRKGTLSEYAGAYAVANTAESMTDSERAAVVGKAESLLNALYNFAAIADIGLEDLGWHWRWLMRLARADKALICSQLVSTCGAAAIPPMNWMCGKASADQVSPGDLARLPGVRRVTIS